MVSHDVGEPWLSFVMSSVRCGSHCGHAISAQQQLILLCTRKCTRTVLYFAIFLFFLHFWRLSDFGRLYRRLQLFYCRTSEAVNTCNLPVAQMNSANKWKYDRLTVAAVDFASFLDGLNNLNTYAAMHVSLSQYFHMQIDAWIPRQFAQCIDKMQATTLDVQTATVHCGSQRRASNKETFAPGCNYLIW